MDSPRFLQLLLGGLHSVSRAWSWLNDNADGLTVVIGFVGIMLLMRQLQQTEELVDRTTTWSMHADVCTAEALVYASQPVEDALTAELNAVIDASDFLETHLELRDRRRKAGVARAQAVRRLGMFRQFLRDSELTYILKAESIATWDVNVDCADLSQADLRHMDLSRCYLRCADLSGARLNHAILHGASLRYAGMGRYNRADDPTDLSDARLNNVDLRNLQCGDQEYGAVIVNAGTDFSMADVRGVDLRCFKGLTARHYSQAISDKLTRWPPLNR